MNENYAVLIILGVISLGYSTTGTFTCASFDNRMCITYGYNMTALPNFAGQNRPRDALIIFHGFVPFIRHGCSTYLKLFMCSVYFPKCRLKQGTRIGPCQSLCNIVLGQCQDVFLKRGLPWPSEFNCSNFETKNDFEENCVEGLYVASENQHSQVVDQNQDPNDSETKLSSLQHVTSTAQNILENPAQCVPTKNEMCLSYGYNLTLMPNLVGDKFQKDAERHIQSFAWLFQHGCSKYLKLFLCSVYFPECSEKSTTLVRPCQSFCQSVQKQCEPILQKLEFTWPSVLNCSNFKKTTEYDENCLRMPRQSNDILNSMGSDQDRHVSKGLSTSSSPTQKHNSSSNDIISRNSKRCIPIRIDMCLSVGYNYTIFPNLVGDKVESDAELRLQTYTPLLQYGCSIHLKLLLCSVFSPKCSKVSGTSIGPCKTLCKSVRKRCLPVLIEFGFPWPSVLKCSRFESKSEEGENCIELPDIPHNTGGSRSPIRPRQSTTEIPLDSDVQRSREQLSKSTMFSTDMMNSNSSISLLENTSVVDLTTSKSTIVVEDNDLPNMGNIMLYSSQSVCTLVLLVIMLRVSFQH